MKEGWWRMMKDERWKINDEGWWFQAVEWFCRLTDRQTNRHVTCDFRVAFTTENMKTILRFIVYTSGAGCHHHFSAQLKSHDSRFISAMDATANGLDILIFIVSLHCWQIVYNCKKKSFSVISK